MADEPVLGFKSIAPRSLASFCPVLGASYGKMGMHGVAGCQCGRMVFEGAPRGGRGGLGSLDGAAVFLGGIYIPLTRL